MMGTFEYKGVRYIRVPEVARNECTGCEFYLRENENTTVSTCGLYELSTKLDLMRDCSIDGLIAALDTPGNRALHAPRMAQRRLGLIGEEDE